MEVKAYVTNLGKYNEGELVGEWVTFPIDEDEQAELFERIGIDTEPNEDGEYYEEYFMTDYDCDIDLYRYYGEYVDINTLNELAELLEFVDEDKLDAVMEVESYKTIEDYVEAMDNYEYINGMTDADYEEELFYESIDTDAYKLLTSGWISGYVTIDFEQMAIDDDYITETSNGLLIQR